MFDVDDDGYATEARVDDDGEDPWLILLGVLRTHPTIDSPPPADLTADISPYLACHAPA